MKLPPLKISETVVAAKPIVQGGMAIRVSRAPLSAAVASCGGIGLIAISGLPKEEIKDQISLARSLTTKPGGLIGVNIMYAAREFNNLVKTAIEEKVDLIVFGAGFSRDVFAIGREAGIPIVPIVSSAKLAVLAKKLGATTIIVESGEAGGHLGTCKGIKELIPEIRKELDETPPSQYNGVEKVTLIAAGGVHCGGDILDMMELGADGVQMATRFVLSKECDVHENFKKLFLESGDDELILIQSSVGMPARAIRTAFSQKILDGTTTQNEKCFQCLKHCSGAFCIIRALQRAREGDLERGLFFTGGNVGKYNDILSVQEIFDRLENEIEMASKQKALLNSKH